MRQRYTLEITFLLIVIAASLIGFSSLVRGDRGAPNGYQLLHIVTSLAWQLLLLGQLVLIRQRHFERHRTIGKWILAVGPILIASMGLLTVHSATKALATGTVDDLVVQNVSFTLQLALLVLLAFVLRRNRDVHGALLLSTALMFLVIAIFFILISYIPGYRIEGPETFDRFAKAGQTSAIVGSVTGLLFFLRNARTGWPWLFVSAFFLAIGYIQVVLEQSGRTKALTVLVGSIGEVPAFGLTLAFFAGLLWMAWKVVPTRRGAS
jgi:uncharacterized membrane protein YozB (DUF420 family)